MARAVYISQHIFTVGHSCSGVTGLLINAKRSSVSALVKYATQLSGYDFIICGQLLQGVNLRFPKLIDKRLTR